LKINSSEQLKVRLPGSEGTAPEQPAQSGVSKRAENGTALRLGWNWKTAALSAAARAPIFALTTASHGLHSVKMAVLVEAAYRVGSSGVFAGITQAIRHQKPIWRSALCITVLIPSVSLWLDYLLHLAMGTPNLKAGIGISLGVSLLTSLFDWYSMHHGVLIVGENGNSFLSDLRALPMLAGKFLTEPPMRLWRNARRLLEAPGE
jgi:hypothetical protein